MLVRHYKFAAALATALFAVTLTPASAQPATGARLGVPEAVLSQAGTAAASEGSAEVQDVRSRRWRRNRSGRLNNWRLNNRRLNNRRRNNRRWRNSGPSIQLYITPQYHYSAPRTYRRSGCDYWSDRCVANWGYRNPDYYGCLRYHGCD